MEFIGDQCVEELFKSDRCGIETCMQTDSVLPGDLFKSDRCGIETADERVHEVRQIMFKSDRCGIETRYRDEG